MSAFKDLVVESIGTENLRFIKNRKVGSLSLEELTYNYENIKLYNESIDELEGKTIIIPIREPLDRWVSGYIYDFCMIYFNDQYRPFFQRAANLTYKNQKGEVVWKNIPEEITNFLRVVHDIDGPMPTDWLYGVQSQHSHTVIDRCVEGVWRNENTDHLGWAPTFRDIYLWSYDKPNVFFVELKYLSNPKLLDWVKQQDKDWENVKSIPKMNTMLADAFNPYKEVEDSSDYRNVIKTMYKFFELYMNNEICSEYNLFSPILLHIPFKQGDESSDYHLKYLGYNNQTWIQLSASKEIFIKFLESDNNLNKIINLGDNNV